MKPMVFIPSTCEWRLGLVLLQWLSSPKVFVLTLLKVIIYSNNLFRRGFCGVDISPSFRKYSMSVLLLCQPNSVHLLHLHTYVTLCMRLFHEGLDEVQLLLETGRYIYTCIRISGLPYDTSLTEG